ncbi:MULTISPECIES: PepSY domain-containing protein [Methylotenera]|uniref:PepSY domain-containing protein n=1 Tax=Methylotenera TaxID=359407 RepID=UPI001E2B6489|nr:MULTISPECIES: PepSY domain-containing protein [Methylotenera]
MLSSNLLGVTSVFAEEDYQLAKKLREKGEILPLERILTFARAKKAGEVLETEFEKKNGRYIYEVEILDAKGQVWELKLDAKTGQLIKIEIDD